MDWQGLFTNLGTYVLGPVIFGAGTYAIMRFTEWNKTRNKFQSIRITAEKNDRIQELLTESRVMLRADRAYLVMFHNGNKYVDGSEVLKKSRTNESVGPGVSFEAQNYQNIKISLMPDEMKLATEEGPSFITVESLKDGKFKRLLLGSGVRAAARCAIRKDKDIIGFIGVDFNDAVNSPENINDLCKYAGVIEQVLSTYR